MLCGHVADSFRFPMLIAASAAAHCGRLTAPPIVLCFALFSPLQKQQRRERKQEWQARAAAEFVFCDEQMDPAATTAMAAPAAAARSGGVGSVALGITAHGDAMAKAAMESHGDAMAKAAMAKAAMANVIRRLRWCVMLWVSSGWGQCGCRVGGAMRRLTRMCLLRVSANGPAMLFVKFSCVGRGLIACPR